MTKLFRMVKRNVLKRYYRFMGLMCNKIARWHGKHSDTYMARYLKQCEINYAGKEMSVWMS